MFEGMRKESPDIDRDFDYVPTGIEAEVCADIAARQRKGIAKYGQTVAENPAALKEWLQHAYEEHLDACIYLKRAMRELDNTLPDRATGNGANRTPETMPG